MPTKNSTQLDTAAQSQTPSGSLEQKAEKQPVSSDIFTEEYSRKKKVRAAYIVLSFYLAVLGEILFFGSEKGIGFFLFVIIYIASFTAVAKITRQIRNRWALVLTVPLLFMGLSVFLYSNALVRYWVPWFVYLLLIFYPLLLSLKNPNKYSFSLTQIRLVRNIFLVVEKIKFVLKDIKSFHLSRISPPHVKVIKKIALALLFSVPILSIFTLLFYHADAVFASWVINFFKLLNIEITVEDFVSLLRVLIFGLGLAVLYYAFLSRDHVLGLKKEKVSKLDDLVVSIILGLINALFAVFVFIQFSYLFGKREFVMSNNMVFAEYARSGFFQLVMVILLAAIMLIAVYRSAVFHQAAKLVVAFQVLLVGQVMVIGISALRRMNVYQEVYGYTVLRLYVEWFIYFSLIILLFAAVALLVNLRFRRFLHASMLAGLCVLAVVSGVNVHGIIARENVRRFVEDNKSIDMEYMRALGFDAAEALRPIFQEDNFQKLTIENKIHLRQLFEDVYNYDLPGAIDAVGYKLSADHARGIVYEFDARQVKNALRAAVEKNSSYDLSVSDLRGDTVGYCDIEQIEKISPSSGVNCVLVKKDGSDYILALSGADKFKLKFYADEKKAEGNDESGVLFAVYKKLPGSGEEKYEKVFEKKFDYIIPYESKEKIQEMREMKKRGLWNGGEYHEVASLTDYRLLSNGALVESHEINKEHVFYTVEWGEEIGLKQEILQENYIPLSQRSQSHYQQGVNYYENKEYDQARQEFFTALSYNPKSGNSYFMIGKSYHEEGDYARAEGYYKQSLELSPGNEYALARLGLLYSDRGDHDRVIIVLEKGFDLIDMRNGNKDVISLMYRDLGASYIKKGYYTKAEQILKKGLGYNETSALHNNLGLAYSKQGRISEAKEQYERAVEMDPSSETAVRNLEIVKKKISDSSG